MLEQFRETPITWDKASRKVYEPLRASAGDNKGRKLSVQVVNDGVIEDLSGASLSLFWETKDKAHNGLDAFTAVDATKGEFEIYYTTGMLSNEGTLNANLVLVDANGRIVSEPFTITVFKGIDDDAIQSSDSFTALTEALIDVSNLEQNYAPRLNDLTAQLQQKAEYTTVWGMDNLSQDVKENMTGGSVAVVGRNAVGDINVVDGSLPINKIKGDIVSKNKFNKTTISSASTLDPTTGNVVTGNADYFVSDYVFVPANQPITFSQSSPRVFYDVDKNYIRSISTLTFTPEVNGYVKFQAMTSLINTSRVLYSATDTGYDDYRYKIQGLVGEVDSEKIKNASDYKGMLYGSGKLIDFDFVNKEIRILANVGLAHRNKRYLTVAQTIAIPQGYPLLMLGYTVGNSFVNLYPTGTIVPDHVIVFGAVNVVDKTVFGIDNYYINGEPSYNYVANEANNYVSEHSLSNVYKTDVPLDAQGLALRDIKAADVYSWYDGLNLTRTLEGTSPEGIPIYSYAKKVVKPPLLDPKAFVLAKTPKAVIFTGTHGEHTAIYTAFKAIERIQNNWKTDENLEALHFNLDIVIVPCVTPFAINNNQRKNANGVDINRNLPSGWWLNPDTASNEYGGTSALSEVEAQVVNSVLNKHKDADIVIDFHNFYLNTEIGHFLWGLADKNNVLSLLNAHIGRMTRESMKTHTFIENPIGYVSPSISGSVSRHASVTYNIPRAYTYEVSESLPQDPAGQPNDGNALTLAHDSFVNMLLMVLNNVIN